jgi:transposase
MLPQSTADQLAGPNDDLEFVRLAPGSYAWLRAERPDRRYALTQAGRALLARWRAEAWLFGREVS